jgi:AAA domain
MSLTVAENNTLDALGFEADRKRAFLLFSDLAKGWLVHNLLGHGECSAFYGKPGDGKSVLAQDLCLHVAAGWQWHGRPVKRGAVIYVALERAKLVERRAIAFREKHGVQDLPFAIVRGVHDFRNPQTAQRFIELADQVEQSTGEQLNLFCIDTLSRGLCGGDENSPKDMGAIVTTTGLLQDKTGAHVSWVHHMPVDGERMRGHGALLGALDTTIHVLKGDSVRTATVVKANDSEEGEQVAFDLESVSISQDGQTTAPIVVPATIPDASASTGPKLTKNQQSMFSLLYEAGPNGLTTDEWNSKARDAGLGVTRKADLYDFRAALKGKGLVKDYCGRWSVISR